MIDQERAAAQKLADRMLKEQTRLGFDLHPSEIGTAIRALRSVAKPAPDYFAALVERARQDAAKAISAWPAPNYTVLKIAEESGEVVRGAVHYAENRMAWPEVEGEIVQLLAMLIRYLREGDAVIGSFPPSHVNDSMNAPVASAKTHAELVEPYASAMRMVRDSIGELFGPIASIESEEAVLLRERGPEPVAEAEAIIAALQRIRERTQPHPAPPADLPPEDIVVAMREAMLPHLNDCAALDFAVEAACERLAALGYAITRRAAAPADLREVVARWLAHRCERDKVMAQYLTSAYEDDADDLLSAIQADGYPLDTLRSTEMQATLRSFMCFLHGLCCPGCMSQGRALADHCCHDADCNAGFYGVDATAIRDLLSAGEALMPGTLAEIENPPEPINEKGGDA